MTQKCEFRSAIRLFIAGIVIVCISVVMHFAKSLDFKLQSYFFVSGKWIIDANEAVQRAFFYDFARSLPVFAAFGICVYSARIRKITHPILKAMTFIILVPLIVNGLKAVTQQACPNEFADFGGKFADNLQFIINTRCFPAGHMSSGLSLLGICFLIEDDRKKKKLTLIILIWTLIIAFYQMAKGVHFLSDTIATFGVTCMILGALNYVFHRYQIARAQEREISNKSEF